MSEVPEDREATDWIHYEGVIGEDPVTHQFTLQLHRHLYWFPTKEEAEEFQVTHAD